MDSSGEKMNSDSEINTTVDSVANEGQAERTLIANDDQANVPVQETVTPAREEHAAVGLVSAVSRPTGEISGLSDKKSSSSDQSRLATENDEKLITGEVNLASLSSTYTSIAHKSFSLVENFSKEPGDNHLKSNVACESTVKLREEGELSSTTEECCLSSSSSAPFAEEKVDSGHKSVSLGLPKKGNLKRRLSESDSCSSSSSGVVEVKKKRRLQFDGVTVYYFPRMQGFTCVPSQGGSTLGMSSAHSHVQQFSIAEHFAEQKKAHRDLITSLRGQMREAGGTGSENESDSCGEPEENPSDLSDDDLDSFYFLQPVPTRQRRALLRASGVNKIECVEKDECKNIRSSREMCGCACKIYCDPETCSCAQAGIKCQVDRINFPCCCSRDGCANCSGRIEFNPVRVRTHFIHTLMRIEMEKNQDTKSSEKVPATAAASNVIDFKTDLPSFRTVTEHLAARTDSVPSCSQSPKAYTELWNSSYQAGLHTAYYEPKRDYPEQHGSFPQRFSYQSETNHFENYGAFDVRQVYQPTTEQPYNFYDYNRVYGKIPDHSLPSSSFTGDAYSTGSYQQTYQPEPTPSVNSTEIRETPVYPDFQAGQQGFDYEAASFQNVPYEHLHFPEQVSEPIQLAAYTEQSTSGYSEKATVTPLGPVHSLVSVPEEVEPTYTDLSFSSAVTSDSLVEQNSAKSSDSEEVETGSESDLATIIKTTMVESVSA